MVRMVIDVEIISGHEDAWEDIWQTFLEERHQRPGFRGAHILRDSERPTHYLILSEWDRHDRLAGAMRSGGIAWLDRGVATAWTTSSLRVYEDVTAGLSDTWQTQTVHNTRRN